ncbi:MAG: hypothetical protein B7Z81_10490 [Acidocella sp. 20-61-6]|nr:MAG: hypothetical protein B7Z81_10490 [Acidocella sp. 20-61-6]
MRKLPNCSAASSTAGRKWAAGTSSSWNPRRTPVPPAQARASTAEAGYTIGAPGATLGKALVASDGAEVAWNATVAVRNEVVSAYQTIMNMQF